MTVNQGTFNDIPNEKKYFKSLTTSSTLDYTPIQKDDVFLISRETSDLFGFKYFSDLVFEVFRYFNFGFLFSLQSRVLLYVRSTYSVSRSA